MGLVHESSSERQGLRGAARRLRVDGVVWLVYELPPPAYDRRQHPSLIFESDAMIRRVRNYPAHWRALADEELVALSWST
jgi:hypothetical protein